MPQARCDTSLRRLGFAGQPRPGSGSGAAGASNKVFSKGLGAFLGL